MNLLSPCLLAACADNGAPSSNFGGTAMSNYPLRGGKATLWEGGIRATGFLWGRGVPAGANNTELFHCADWMPTFVALAGGSIPASRQLDGYDIWKAIAKGDHVTLNRMMRVVESMLEKGNDAIIRQPESQQ